MTPDTPTPDLHALANETAKEINARLNTTHYVDLAAIIARHFEPMARELADAKHATEITRKAALKAVELATAERAYSDERSGLLIECAKERDQLRAEVERLTKERDEALKDYEEALAERNKAWRRADEIEADNATRTTRDQYREREVKKLSAELADLRARVAALEADRERLIDAFSEIMAYTDPVEDRAYVIAEAAIYTARQQETNQ